jgi:hypothetical protein
MIRDLFRGKMLFCSFLGLLSVAMSSSVTHGALPSLAIMNVEPERQTPHTYG